MATHEDEFEQVLRGLLGRASEAAESEMGDGFDRRVLASISSARHGEQLIALENVCSNLDEYEIAVTDPERRALLALADSWGLGERDRRLIEFLPNA